MRKVSKVANSGTVYRVKNKYRAEINVGYDKGKVIRKTKNFESEEEARRWLIRLKITLLEKELMRWI